MLDLLDLSIGKSKREPTADEKLAALSRDTRRRKKILQDAWAESQRIDTVKHAKIHGLVGYEMLRRKDEQKRDVEEWFRTLDVTHRSTGSVDARELIEPMAILGVARDRAAVERLANAINEKDADGEPGLNMDEFRDFAITNGLRPAELRKRRRRARATCSPSRRRSPSRGGARCSTRSWAPGPPRRRRSASSSTSLRVIENCADWAACVDPPPPKARSTRPRRPFAARLDAELSRRKRAAAVPPRYHKKTAAKKPMQALLGAFDRTKRFDMTLPKSPKRKPPRERRADPDYTAVTVYRPGSSWPAVVRVSTRPPDETAALRTVTFLESRCRAGVSRRRDCVCGFCAC